MWIAFAFGSALFAGLTSILAKCGIRKTDSTTATAIRTVVVLLFSWLKHIARYKWALANLAFLALAQHIYQNRPIQVAERALYTPSPG